MQPVRSITIYKKAGAAVAPIGRLLLSTALLLLSVVPSPFSHIPAHAESGGGFQLPPPAGKTLPGPSTEWSPEALDILAMLNRYEIGTVMIDRFNDAGGHFGRLDIELPRGTLAIYNPNDLVIKIRPQDSGPLGSLTGTPTRDFVATVTHEFWHAYFQQVVQAGYDPATAQLVQSTATWLTGQTLVKSASSDSITGAQLSSATDFVDEYVGALINDLVGGPAGYVSIKQRLDRGELSPTAAQNAWQARIDFVKRDKIEAYEGAGEQVYEVQSPPPPELVDHLINLLSLTFPAPALPPAATPGPVGTSFPNPTAGPGGTTFPSGTATPDATGVPTQVSLRPPVVQPVTAVFTQATFSTTYKANATDTSGGTLSYKWSGPNCGTTTDAQQATFTWTHPHPPCDPTTDHADVTITLAVSNSIATIICTYQGAGSGSGNPCHPL